MKRLLCVVAMLGILLSTHAVSAEEPQGAVIEFRTKVFDLGTLTQDDDRQMVRVPFTNVGDAPLVVLQVRTSCSCTTVQYERRKIMPSEQGVLNISMDPSKAPTGSFYRVLQVISNATPSPANLTLKAVIE